MPSATVVSLKLLIHLLITTWSILTNVPLLGKCITDFDYIFLPLPRSFRVVASQNPARKSSFPAVGKAAKSSQARKFPCATYRVTVCCYKSIYTVLQKVYHLTFNYNFNSSCPIPVIFGTVITEKNMSLKRWINFPPQLVKL